MNIHAPISVYDGIVFKSVDAVPMDNWRWPNFTPDELKCKGTGKVRIDERSLDCLQRARDLIGKPLSITSAYRSPSHNKKVGGAKASKHLDALAYDIRTGGHNPAHLEACLRVAGFTGFGFYKRQGFIHADTARPRKWGERWYEFETVTAYMALISPPATDASGFADEVNEKSGGSIKEAPEQDAEEFASVGDFMRSIFKPAKRRRR